MQTISKVKRMRLKLNLTQRQLAKLVGVKPPTVNLIERRGIYNTLTARKYAAAMKVSPILLLEGLD